MNVSQLLVDQPQAARLFFALSEPIKAHLAAGRRLVLSVKFEKRSEAQSRKFHATCRDVSRSGTPWMGKPRTALQWKVLFISGHAMATDQPSEMVPGLEGEFVNIRESSASMSIPRGSSLIEYTLAWCAVNEIKLRAYE